jgi:hypothetical protein
LFQRQVMHRIAAHRIAIKQGRISLPYLLFCSAPLQRDNGDAYSKGSSPCNGVG